VARAASLDRSHWLPSYAWWPPPQDYSVTVVLTPYHATVDPRAEFEFVLRGYQGSSEPLWEREVGRARFGEQFGVRLDDLDLPEPPDSHGAILEIHSVRLDREPKQPEFVGMWVDAQGRDGGGYLIPTIPIRGAKKMIARDDLQVVPGIIVNREIDSEVLLLNATDRPTEARLVAHSLDGLRAEGAPFELGPWSAWRGSVAGAVPPARRLLAASDGLGSLSIYSDLKVLPYFGFRGPGRPVVSMDHSAPIFG
jgi:hypothetical protein